MSDDPYAPGTRVEHAVYGTGTVKQSRGETASNIYVEFDSERPDHVVDIRDCKVIE